MSVTLDEFEKVVQQLGAEHRRLAELLMSQRAAMTGLNAPQIEALAIQQEALRTRMSVIDNRRRTLALQAARELRIALPANTEPSLKQIAAVCDPARRARLMAIRQDLRGQVDTVVSAAHVASRLAGAVLGHLNTAMRLISSATRDAGTYTRSGAPRVGGRIGAVEAVG